MALARALVFHPPVLLMDEPLGALDRKLRQRMQIEIKMLHREIGTTIIFVTHDQEEALSMADRIAVLDHGRLQQIGAPRELYDMPANAFVADFIGETNLLDVEIVESGAIQTTVKLLGSAVRDRRRGRGYRGDRDRDRLRRRDDQPAARDRRPPRGCASAGAKGARPLVGRRQGSCAPECRYVPALRFVT